MIPIGGFDRGRLSLREKFFRISPIYLMLITAVASVGFIALYSAAGGHLEPWAFKHAVRFAVGLCGLLVVALIDFRYWHRFAWWIYAACFILLVIVDIKGHIGMGAQRWINLGFIQLQPSEMMKVAVIIALARYFSSLPPEDVSRPVHLLVALGVVFLPTGLVMIQPDLGTSLMIVFAAGAMFFLAGVSYWFFGLALSAVAAIVPIGWHFMHDYQKKRVLTFMDPEADPLGSGYHIMQSKIALGSGGFHGKGFLNGSQAYLNFLPEKQTDFIFTLLMEEWGFVGGIFLLCLLALVIAYGFGMALSSGSPFGRLLATGITVNFALYAIINIAMVMGLLPVVGIPLPMISNGGTVMLSVLFGFGLIMSVHVHRESRL